MFDFFTHTFTIYALIIGIFLGLGAALLSSFLVLNHQSMIADGLSHVAFTGIIFGLLAFPDQPIYLALPIAILASILITYLGQLKMIEHDAAIGVVSAFVLAIGLITITLSNGVNQSIESLLRGSIFTTLVSDVVLSGMMFLLVTIFVLVSYRSLLSLSYDETFARFSKVKHQLLKYLLSALTAIFIVIGVRTVGMLLISSFIVFPSLIASQVSKSFKQNMLISCIMAFLVVTIGIYVSYELDIPPGSTMVVVYTIVLMFAIIFRKMLRRA